jgi:hypothetical protein
MTNLPWASNYPVLNSFVWKNWNKKSWYFEEKRVFCLKYENLVHTPKNVLKDMCNFLDIEFENRMVNHTSSAEQVITEREPWKRKVKKPIEKKNAFKWKRDIKPECDRAISIVCHKGIKRYDYTGTQYPRKKILSYGLKYANFQKSKFEKSISGTAKRFLCRGIMLEPISTSNLHRIDTMDKEQIAIFRMPPLGKRKIKRGLRLIRVIARIGAELASGSRVYYWREHACTDERLSALLHVILLFLCEEIESV